MCPSILATVLTLLNRGRNGSLGDPPRKRWHRPWPGHRGMIAGDLGLQYRSASGGLAFTGAQNVPLGSAGWH